MYLKLLLIFFFPLLILRIPNFIKLFLDYENPNAKIGYNLIAHKCTLKNFNCEFIANFMDIKELEQPLSDLLNRSNPYITIKIITRFVSEDIFSLKIEEIPRKDQYEFPFYKDSKTENLNFLNISYNLIITNSPFSLKIVRSENNQLIFYFEPDMFIFGENLINFHGKINNKEIFGLGQRFSPFKLLPNKVYTFWNKDNPANNHNNYIHSYGSHPMYLAREEFDKFHIVFFKNINPLEINYYDEKTLIFSMLGGIIDIYFFFGDEYPETVIKKYHKFIDGYSLPPFWSFGFFQSRFGYKSITEVEEVVKRYRYYDIPLEGVFLDIDYMNNKSTFTIDFENYDPKKIKQLKEKYDLKLIPILDPLIEVKTDNNSIINEENGYICDEHPADKGLQYDIFLKDELNNPFVGKQWVSKGYIPDFTHPNISLYMKEMLQCLYKYIPFDGLWLDMNEISLYNTKIQYSDHKNHPTELYLDNFSEGLREGTVDTDLIHYNNESEFNTHNLFPFRQVNTTKNIIQLLTNKSLTFILTRANMFGMGKISQHWSGDNNADYEFLKLSIASIFNMNLFGIPMTGSDICGHQGDSNEDLCGRWFQLGSFYPFSRNHNNEISVGHEAFAMGNEVLKGTKKNLNLRYSLLKYYYSIFVAQKGIGTIFKPIFFNFPKDENCFLDENIESQFMIGEHLMGIPILENNSKERNGFFSLESKWYDFYNGEEILQENIVIFNEISDPIKLYIAGGGIIFVQNTKNLKNSNDLNDIFNLIIAFDNNNYSKGKIIGISNFNENIIEKFCVFGNCLVNFECYKSFINKILTIQFNIFWEDEKTNNLLKENGEKFSKIKNLKFYGLKLHIYKFDIKFSINGITQNKVLKFINTQNYYIIELPSEFEIDKNIEIVFICF